MIQAMIVCPKTAKAVPTGIAFGSFAAFDGTTLINNSVQRAADVEAHLVDNSTL